MLTRYMKRLVLGYIMSSTVLSDDEKIFLRLAKRKNIEIVFFNAEKDIDGKELKKKSEKCHIIFNSTAEEFELELAKTLESLGKKVIDSPKAFYYAEDKWVFFVKSLEHGIPVPETILLSENLAVAEAELRRFSHWPVVLKRVSGCQGEFVARAMDEKEAMKAVKRLSAEGEERMPVIAQEFVKSHNYRVLLIGGKIVQCVLKKSTGWKATGAWAQRHLRFKPDSALKEIVRKVVNLTGIKICGIDLVKKNGKWLVLEVNSEPTFGFIEVDRKKLIGKALDFFRRHAIEHHLL